MPPKLGLLSEGQFTEVRDLKNTEYEAYKRAAARLLRFSSDQQLFMVVRLNYEEYERLLTRYFGEYSENPSMDWPRFERMILGINRHILNYLSSVRTFLDHSETNLKRRHGKASRRVRRFKEACSKAYDSNFSYRFLYRLRSYVQHCGMPLGRLRLSSKVTGPSSKDVLHSLSVEFNSGELLNEFSWGSLLTEEIRKLPPNFDINSHIEEMQKCLEKINIVLIGENLPELVRSAEYIRTLVAETGHKLGVPCIFRIENLERTQEGQVGQLTLGIEWIPLHVVEMVAHIEKLSGKGQP